MNEFVYKGNQKLRYGYTTGSCAAAASKAAAIMLLTKNRIEEIFLMTPKGIGLNLLVEEIHIEKNKVSCAIRKDAGDDADATHGILIFSTVEFLKANDSVCKNVEKSNIKDNSIEENVENHNVKDNSIEENVENHNVKDNSIEQNVENHNVKDNTVEQNLGNSNIEELNEKNIVIDGGFGVGRVTKPGLEQPVGAAAINRIPRQMIREAVLEVMESCSYTGSLKVTISVPQGEEIGVKTFNPRLGITGGISILGTSGIVEQMSEAALVATIHTEMKQKTYGGVKALLVTPGNYGRDFAKAQFGIDLETGLKCSNFIGETIDMAYEFQLEKILLIGHIGKLVKVAAGIMNTHSKWADARMETICAAALVAGAEADLCRNILNCITTDDALLLLKKNNLLEKTMQYIVKKIEENLNRRAYDGLKVEVIVFSNVFGVLGVTNNAMQVLEDVKNLS